MLQAYRIALVALLALLAFPAAAQDGRSRALVTGIRRYPKYAQTEPLQFANQDADTFGEYLRSGKAGKFDLREIALLRDEEAGFDRMSLELRKVLLGAQPGDSVYLFVSARGIARPDAKDGYIGTAGLVELKPQSGGIAVSDLAEMIRYSKASRVYLFADVCREQSSQNIDNRINFRMEELGTIPKLSGILASDRQKLSKEDPQLKRGVFSYVLVNGLNGQPGPDGARLAAGRVTPAEVFEYLRKEVALTTGNYKQIPKQVGGNRNLLKAPLWLNVSNAPNASNAFDFPRLPLLLAGLRYLPGLLAMQAAAQAPNSSRDLAQRTTADLDALIGRVTAFAERGQRVVAEYGISGFLPEDPKKLTDADFDAAARDFAAAASLVNPGDPVFGDYRKGLEARRNLCSGIAHAYRREGEVARRDLNAARQLAGKSLPEIDNATGITYLEEGTRYDAAIRYFSLAKSESPGWPYPRHNLALTYAEKGDAAAAEREYREAIARAPNEPYLDYNLGLLLHRANRKREARKAYEGALQKLDIAAKTYAERGREWETALPEEARIARARSAMFEKTKADVHNALGALFESQGAAKPAAAEYRAAIQVNVDLCPPRYNLALLRQRESPEESRTELEETVRRCPAFHPARVRLATLDLAGGRIPEAESGYLEVLEQLPANVESKRGLARVRTAQKRFPEAEDLVGAVLREQPGDPLANEQLGDIAAARGGRACDLYTKALHAAKTAVYPGDMRQLRGKRRAACQ